MNEESIWPNHRKIVIIAFVVGALSLVVSLILFFAILLPKIKDAAARTREKEAALEQQASASTAAPLHPNTITPSPLTDDVSQLVIQGKNLDYRGEYSKLGPIADKILSLAKNDKDIAMGYYLKSSSELFLKDYVESKKSANNALSHDPNLADAYNILSLIAGNEANNELSLQYAQKAIAIDPNNAWAHSLLGIAYNFKGWYALSVEELEKAISLDPNNQSYKDNLRYIKSQVSQ